MPVVNRIAAMKEEITAWRRDLHEHPELSYQEVRTAKIVADHLKNLGLEVRTGVGGNGVVGILRQILVEVFVNDSFQPNRLGDLLDTECRSCRTIAFPIIVVTR